MISVCMATYNGEKYIELQLRSILPQLSEDDEVIVSDDASTDQTLDVVRRLNDNRIKIVHHETDHGYTRNFENALKYAKGDYIFLSDQDDEWLPEKVQVTLQALPAVTLLKSIRTLKHRLFSIKKPPCSNEQGGFLFYLRQCKKL